MAEKTAVHAFVTGRVQGVFYRDSAKKKAQKLGLTGWVKNLPDGRVELIASGDDNAVGELMEWLWKGPRAADVTIVETNMIPYQSFDDFRVSRSS